MIYCREIDIRFDLYLLRDDAGTFNQWIVRWAAYVEYIDVLRSSYPAICRFLSLSDPPSPLISGPGNCS
jgi:hypothetical protein